MLLHDPVAGEKRDNVRKLLLSLRDGFDGVLAVLRREKWASYEELLQSWVRYGLQLDFRSSLPAGSDDSLSQSSSQSPSQNQTATATVTATATATVISAPASAPLTLSPRDLAHIPSVFGVPVHDLGQLKTEHWGQHRAQHTTQQDAKTNDKNEDNLANPGAGSDRNKHEAQQGRKKVEVRYLMRIDQLLLRESVRRGLCMRGHIYRSVMWGFVDPETLQAGARIDRGGFGKERDEEQEEEGELDVKVSWF